MDGEFLLDIKEVMESVETAEVISISFPTFGKAAIIDTRASETEGPMVRIMPMVSSPRERARSIRRVRPGFPRARNLTVIPWPRYVESLVTQGIWGKIEQRMLDSGHDEAVAACKKVLGDLRRLEREELIAAVTGDNYHTIWSAEQ
jgi:hypothetical protein